MSITVDDTTLVKCVAMTADPAFIDITGIKTGSTTGTYNPTFTGERGWMHNVDAEPLDLGVELTGDKLAICYKHTVVEIENAMLIAAPIGAQSQASVQSASVRSSKTTQRYSPALPVDKVALDDRDESYLD